MKEHARIRGLLVMANITQEQLAKQLDLSRATLSMKLSKKQPFRPGEMKAIQNLLNSRLGLKLTIDELFF